LRRGARVPGGANIVVNPAVDLLERRTHERWSRNESFGLEPVKLLLRNNLSPGDVVMLTAAVRDLHRTFPGRFVTDVRTTSMPLWEGNPHLTPLTEDDPEVRQVECHYPLINTCNEGTHHFIHGFMQHLGEELGLRIEPGPFKGDIHLAPIERQWMSQVQEIIGEEIPFWIIVAGGKQDFTIKWWDAARWQQVVDHFQGRILFVQVGEGGHVHPALRGVLDLRGQTDLRQLVRLVYHAQGVVCPVTLLMHLAAAVEGKDGRPKNRPCVVVAGGREPAHWEAYPHHQFIHTNGALQCCEQGGCWRARTVPLGDGDEKDQSLCVDVRPADSDAARSGPLARCMDMITAAEVARRIELYFQGGVLPFLTPVQAELAAGRIPALRWGHSIPESPTSQ
jgi:ADP-heptose:LPS heptosyltransferase